MSGRLPTFTAVAVTAAVALALTSVILNIVILTKSNTINSNTNAIQTAINKGTPTVPPAASPINSTMAGTSTVPLSTVSTGSSTVSSSTVSPGSSTVPPSTVSPGSSTVPPSIVSPGSSTASTTPVPSQDCTATTVSNSTGWTQAAAYLLSGIDTSIDPCQDFYAFTCNKYLASVKLGPNQDRKGTYDDSQALVNQQIAGFLKNVDSTDAKISLTERITKRALDSCTQVFTSNNDYTADVQVEIVTLFGAAPFAGGQLKPGIDLFVIDGTLAQTHALGTLAFSWASVDYKNVQSNALYISQPSLDMPHDYFVKPQFIDKLDDEQDSIFKIMQLYRNTIKSNTTDVELKKAAQEVVNFEMLIAMASWSDELQRNYQQQYNPYLLESLKIAYPNLNWDGYLDALFSGVQGVDQVKTDGVVLSQPSYFGWLDSVFNGNLVPKETIANYMIVQLLQDDTGFWGGNMREILMKKNYIQHVWRRGKGVTRIGRRHFRRFDDDPAVTKCMDLLMAYMPYGPGYTYVKNIMNREDIKADVIKQTDLVIQNFQNMWNSLDWLDDQSHAMALNKSNSLFKNYLYPTTLFGDFNNTAVIDAYHQDYVEILNHDVTDFYDILLVLKRGMVVREALRLLNPDDDMVWGSLRANFLQSPAMVNAWYQPERNSITFPLAILNPPYYRLDFPQAYNYAGQGGTSGHELTHGFDDEGVQFDWDGSMTDCDGKYKCGWMDKQSNDGFTNMAQCVVSQYSSQCCPLKTGNVHCANGATTQGENIADLGGQQAAYFAYRQYVQQLGHEEDRLPGLAQFTPNQIFWITYGYSWCMKQTDDNLVNQLLTNPHSPAECRTNNVVQDIPQFARDFNCPAGSPMFPLPDQRCKVWVGY